MNRQLLIRSNSNNNKSLTILSTLFSFIIIIILSILLYYIKYFYSISVNISNDLQFINKIIKYSELKNISLVNDIDKIHYLVNRVCSIMNCTTLI